MVKRYVFGLFLFSSVLLVGACQKENVKVPVSGEVGEKIQAPLINTDGDEIGEVFVSEGRDGVTVQVEAKDLPSGMHGFHIHEKGECTPPNFESAGGHFNPTNKEHGFDNPKGFHLGDLPNIEVKEDGTVAAVISNIDVTLQPGQEHSILSGDGSAIIIHEKADDYRTNPAGDAGARIACAVLQK